MRKEQETARDSEGKREYEKPEVRSEEVFETLAFSCNKATEQCLPGGGNNVIKS
jgi:hypothetical protein